MKKMKKVLALIMAMTMVLGMGLTTFAAEGIKPTANDAAKITITGIEDTDVTYAAYQLIDASYDNNGFIGYVWATGMKNAGNKVTDPANDQITSDLVTRLASNPTALTQFDGDPSVDGAQFDPSEDALTVGTWMILVTPGSNASAVYNPMVVSVYYDPDTASSTNNDMVSGTINADNNWGLTVENAFAKSTEVEDEVQKDVDDAEISNTDTATFTLTGVIPSYAATYYDTSTLTYSLKDTIVYGLAYVLTGDKVDVTVKNGLGEDIDASNYTVTMGSDNKSFTIAFTSGYIAGLAGSAKDARTVTVEYSAKITEEAYSVNGENQVEVIYTNKPDSTTTADPKKQYTYTGSVDGIFKKIGEGDDVNGLEGAEFTLYGGVATAYSSADKVNEAIENEELAEFATSAPTSADDGYDIEFKGLDLDEVYYLKETKAPAGYSLNSTIYQISFLDLVYENSGTSGDNKLTSYKVNVKNMTTGANEGEFQIRYGTAYTDTPMNIENTKISQLPSTGGIGTTIFTVGGCVIMIAAAALFFMNRRKSEE